MTEDQREKFTRKAGKITGDLATPVCNVPLYGTHRDLRLVALASVPS